MNEQIYIQVRFEDESIDDVLSTLTKAGAERVTAKEGLGMTGGEVVTAFIAVQLFADLVVKLVRLFSSGIVVDARGPELKIQKTPSLPRGSVLVINREGMQVTFKDPSAPLLEFLTGLFKASQANG